MKPLKIPLFVVGMLAPFLLTAQSLHLTGSVPSNQTLNVPLTTTVSFTFDQPLQPGTVVLDSIGERFVVIPNDKIILHQMDVTPDGRSLVFAVTHQADVDYTWAFFGVRSTTGAVMTDFNAVSYTTGSSWSSFSVQGRLLVENSPTPVTFASSVVMLLSDLSFMNEENSDGPQNEMLYATVPDPTSGAYAFPSVKPGTYYVLAMMFGSLGENMEPVRIGMQRNALGEPMPLMVTDASVGPVDLRMELSNMGPPDPIDAVQAFVFADAILSVEQPLAEPIVMEGNTQSMPANGDSGEWMVAYFNDADSMVTMIMTDGQRVLGRESMHLMSMPENERPPVDLATIKPIPDTFVPSRSAYQIALQNGLGSDIATFSQNGAHWQNVNYRLAHFYFEFPDLLTVSSNPYWLIRYQVQTMMGGMEIAYLVDAVTGNFIGRREMTDPWTPGVLELMSSNPGSLSANVPLQTRVSFTFNEPIQVGTLNIESRRFTWSVMPEDRIQIHQISYSEDYRTVFMDVSLTADTDYAWTFQSIRSTQGAALRAAAVVYHTTAPAISPLKIEGALNWPDPMSAPQTDQALAVVVLLDSPDYFLNGMQGPPPGIRNVGSTMPGTWNYSIANVRPGTYYPAVFVIANGMEFGQLIAFGYLSDGTGFPQSVTVSDQSLTALHLPLQFANQGEEHHPFDLMTIYQGVLDRIASEESAMKLYEVSGREEVSDMNPTPSGLSYEWSFVFFEDVTDTVMMIQIDSQGRTTRERFHLSTVPIEERPPMEGVVPLTSNLIPSTQAMSVALNNGLSQLIADKPANSWAQVRYDASGFHFRYPDWLTSGSNPYWNIQYNGEKWDDLRGLVWQTEAVFLVDAITGAFINKRVSTDLDDTEAPSAIRLEQNYPNPFNPSTVVGFQLSVFSNASLKVYDILGREVAVLVDGWMPAGSHSVTFDASDLTSGVYVYRLTVGGQTLQRKLTLIR